MIAEFEGVGGNNDQVDRRCICLDPRGIRTGHASHTTASIGQYGHTGPGSVWRGESTN